LSRIQQELTMNRNEIQERIERTSEANEKQLTVSEVGKIDNPMSMFLTIAKADAGVAVLNNEICERIFGQKPQPRTKGSSSGIIQDCNKMETNCPKDGSVASKDGPMVSDPLNPAYKHPAWTDTYYR